MKNPRTKTRIAKPDFNGDASLFLGLEPLRPLAAFPFASRPISDHLHSLGHGWYLLIGTRDCVDDDLPKETVRACMVVWSTDLASVLLATRCDDSVGEVAQPSNSLPPVEEFVSATGWTYGELVKAGLSKVMETGTYGSDGIFLFKELWFPKAHIYFRSRRRKNSELPFAISIMCKPASG